jgi:hypothetical protein
MNAAIVKSRAECVKLKHHFPRSLTRLVMAAHDITAAVRVCVVPRKS